MRTPQSIHAAVFIFSRPCFHGRYAAAANDQPRAGIQKPVVLKTWALSEIDFMAAPLSEAGSLLGLSTVYGNSQHFAACLDYTSEYGF